MYIFQDELKSSSPREVVQKCRDRLWNPFVLSNLARIAGGQTRIGLWSYSVNKADGGAGGVMKLFRGDLKKRHSGYLGKRLCMDLVYPSSCS